MAKFDVEVNGIPFQVDGVESEQDAIDQVRLAAEQDPLLFQNKALSLGYDFDFETQQGRERGELSKFLIGTGKTFDDAIDFVHEAFLEQTGTDFAELQRFDNVQAQEEEAFEALRSQSPLTVGAGQFLPEIAAGGAGGALAVKGLFRLAKAISPLRWAKKAGKKALKKFSDEGVSAETLAAAGKTRQGKQLLESLSRLRNPSDKTLEAFARNLKKAADEFTSGPTFKGN